MPKSHNERPAFIKNIGICIFAMCLVGTFAALVVLTGICFVMWEVDFGPTTMACARVAFLGGFLFALSCIGELWRDLNEE